MEREEKFTLIDGLFNPESAITLISVLYSTKIEFHNRNILKAHEEFGTDLPQEEKRVFELENARQAFQMKMREAASQGFQVEIKSFIEVTFVKKTEGAI